MSSPSDLATALVIGQLPDAELLGQLRSLVRVRNQLLAEALPLAGEVEHRRLYLNAACSSMFGYCTQRLGMSEQASDIPHGISRSVLHGFLQGLHDRL